MKVCIICIQKNEENYINEWINYHLSIGIDNIFVCNNDDPKDKRLYDTIHNDKVQIVDYQGVDGVQPIAYTKEFKRLQSEFDWLIFIDIDEFIILDGYNDIKEFLSLDRFKECSSIKMNMKIFDDDGIIDVENDDYSVMKRFKHNIENERNHWQKSIIRGSVDICDKRIFGHGYYDGGEDYISVNVLGERVNNHHKECKEYPVIHEQCWLNHYPTKSIGEYIRQKYFRGGPNRNPQRYFNLNYFWKYNKRTDEKEKYAKELINELQEKGYHTRLPRVYRDKTGKLIVNKEL